MWIPGSDVRRKRRLRFSATARGIADTVDRGETIAVPVNRNGFDPGVAEDRHPIRPLAADRRPAVDWIMVAVNDEGLDTVSRESFEATQEAELRADSSL
ncbi:MAG: hypothetical protein QOF33_2836 [Thermomicrobiales bacterium]|nr:hypothetical protein [Thermomicrobiales bacterium]